MEEVKLFEHNEIAYKKLNNMLEHSKTATINHATGTGKSFIALKYLYEHRDKKCLYIAPTYYILNQLKEDCHILGFKPEDLNMDTIIYTNLYKHNMDELYQKYDVIIFDEYHRTGATKTYQSIKQLKLNLMEHDDDKRFIGLTATPIRYLDRERNMTKEIFDDNVASRLSLAEAILEGLLPVPSYLNAKYACYPEFTRLYKRVEKLYPSPYKNKLLSILKDVGFNLQEGDPNIETVLRSHIQDGNGKYIIFCSTTDKLTEYYKEFDTWFVNYKNVNKYKVHTYQKKEENEQELSDFEKSNEGISVLFCVDVLNEGIHVSNIDGVILLRPTISPIIYFQQIGRALSFSGRNKDITIFDLVNNFGNHNAIDLLYQELQDEARRKIIENPENAERYKSIVEKFKIMDETRDAINKLTEVKTLLTREKIIESKINYGIDCINNIVNVKKQFLFDDIEAKKAYMYIARNYKYVTNEQFKKLSELNIILPETLNISEEERKIAVGEFDTIHKFEQSNNGKLYEDLEKFIDTHNRRPFSDSKDESESKLSQHLLNSMSGMTLAERKKIYRLFSKNKIELEIYEKIMLGVTITSNEMDSFISDISQYTDENIRMPIYYREALEIAVIKYTVKQNLKFFELIEADDKIILQEREKYERNRQQLLTQTIDIVGECAQIPENQIVEKIGQSLKQMSAGDRKYIRDIVSKIKLEHYKSVFDIQDEPISSFKRLKNAQLTEQAEKLTDELEYNETLKKTISFMAQHNGAKPDSNSTDESEKILALELEQHLEKRNLGQQYDEFEESFDRVLYDSRQIMEKIIADSNQMCTKKLSIIEYLKFFNDKGRRPMSNSSDEEERELAERYQRDCQSLLTSTEVDELNAVFNSRKAIRKSCSTYFANKSNEER